MLAGLAVGIGVPILLFYVYGVVPISLCRSGGCGVSTSGSGVRFEFDDENELMGALGAGNTGGNVYTYIYMSSRCRGLCRCSPLLGLLIHRDARSESEFDYFLGQVDAYYTVRVCAHIYALVGLRRRRANDARLKVGRLG